MFSGFDPTQARKPFFERRRGVALSLAVLVHLILGAVIVWIEMTRDDEEIVDVGLDEPEIENLDVEEEIEVEEEEPEPEPEPEKPKPRPREQIQNVQKQTEHVSESDVAVQREEPVYETQPVREKPKEQPKPVEEKPKPKQRQGIGDREKPRAMPADGTAPKPDKGNKAPAYPESLRKKNVTGVIKVKLNIHMDGSVRGMKVLRKKISGAESPEEEERAKKLFLKAVIDAVKTWKFQPAKLKGKTVSVWWPVTIPFNLN